MYNWLAMLRIAAVLSMLGVWAALYVDESRRVDLNTQRYVDLEDVAALQNAYDVVCVFALLLTLFSALEFFEISEKLSISACAGLDPGTLWVAPPRATHDRPESLNRDSCAQRSTRCTATTSGTCAPRWRGGSTRLRSTRAVPKRT